MKHTYRRFVTSVLASLLVVAFAVPVSAAKPDGFEIVSESATYSPGQDEVKFRIAFSQEPDFFTIDEFNRPANSIQHFIMGDPSLPGSFTAIIRGDEIRFTDGLVPIRNAFPQDDDIARSGGWGTIRGEVPYSLHGRVLRFSVPLSLITDQTDGAIAYELGSYAFGSITSHFEGTIQLR